MARVAVLCPDLLFGSKLEGALRAAGHEVLAAEADAEADALIVDLTADVGERLPRAAESPAATLAFYAHVERDVRRRAEEAGIDLVVPRGRMAREAPALVERLLAR